MVVSILLVLDVILEDQLLQIELDHHNVSILLVLDVILEV